jgi:hypothetical protein
MNTATDSNRRFWSTWIVAKLFMRITPKYSEMGVNG